MSKQAWKEINFPSFNEPYSDNINRSQFKQSSKCPKFMKRLKNDKNSGICEENNTINQKTKSKNKNPNQQNNSLNFNYVRGDNSLSPLVSVKEFNSTNPPDTWKNRMYQSNSLRQRQSSLIFNKIKRDEDLERNLNISLLQNNQYFGNRSLSNVDTYSNKNKMISVANLNENIVRKKIYIKSFEQFRLLRNIFPNEEQNLKKRIPSGAKFLKFNKKISSEKKLHINNELVSKLNLNMNKGPILNNTPI